MGGWAALMDTIWGGRYLIGYWFVGDVICANVMKIYNSECICYES